MLSHHRLQGVGILQKFLQWHGEVDREGARELALAVARRELGGATK